LKNRSRIEIIAADILERIMNDGTMSSSKLMLKAFLTYKQSKEYLPFLLQNEFVKYDDKDRTLRITSKGLHFLEMYNRLPEFVERTDRLRT
jgi:predicted transcriptional regulator